MACPGRAHQNAGERAGCVQGEEGRCIHCGKPMHPTARIKDIQWRLKAAAAARKVKAAKRQLATLRRRERARRAAGRAAR